MPAYVTEVPPAARTGAVRPQTCYAKHCDEGKYELPPAGRASRNIELKEKPTPSRAQPPRQMADVPALRWRKAEGKTGYAKHGDEGRSPWKR